MTHIANTNSIKRNIIGTHNGELVRIKYDKAFVKAANNFLELYGLQPSAHYISSISESKKWFNPPEQQPCRFETWWLEEGEGKIISCISQMTEGKLPPFRIWLDEHNHSNFIKQITVVQKCLNCGVIYVEQHKCNYKAATYYQHNVNTETRGNWQFVKFFPVGCIPDTKRLFIVYDLETYTWHGPAGKQLVPYLIAFHIMGDEALKLIAAEVAKELEFEYLENCFYLFNKNPNIIGTKFKKFREQVQKTCVRKLWNIFAQGNKLQLNVTSSKLFDMCKKGQLNFSMDPSWWEIIVVGHNITGFDEIIMAAHVASTKPDEDMAVSYKIERTFMPRAGKLLFNDIVYKLPNPRYVKPTRQRFEAWKTGAVTWEDMKYQGIKFMIRDTFLLTHASLRQTATAYNLKVEKGHCPYSAINEFFMLGDYEKEEDDYPVMKYWNDETEYKENKEKFNRPYDILGEAIKYCIKDVILTAHLVDALLRGYDKFCKDEVNLQCSFNVFQRPTISSTTHALFKQVYYKYSESPREYLPMYMVPSEEMYEFVRQSVRGGRCYPSFIGIFEKPVYVYDVCGMYASALTHPMPIGNVMSPFEAAVEIDKWQEKLTNSDTISYFDTSIKPMIATVSCDPPSSTWLDVLPPICVKVGGRLWWSNEYIDKAILTSIDIIVLHNRGWKCTIERDMPYVVWPEFKPICSDYVKINIKAKENADKTGNQVQRSISKLLSNALYGSFCTKLDNKRVVFENDMTEEDKNSIRTEESEIITRTTLISNMIPTNDFTKWQKFFNLPHKTADENAECCAPPMKRPFIAANIDTPTKATGIIFAEAECDSLVLTTIAKKTQWIENRSYPTQLASFVLAWTRAFMSEWSNILYGKDRGKTYIENRQMKTLYGDTDSLFVTELGHKLMLTRGHHRLKSNNASLVFDPSNPKLTWAVECETVCQKCKKPAFASASCYLAPKLYALKDTCCPECGHIGPGKVRAKGHNRQTIDYDLLKNCFEHYDLFRPAEEEKLMEPPPEEYQTSRLSLKRTIMPSLSTTAAFTVVEKQLTRILRPWTNMTQRLGPREGTGYFLYPFDKTHPSQNTTEKSTENPFWDGTLETC